MDRENTGRGGLIEFSQAENVMAEIGEFFLDYQFNDRDPGRLGNTDPHLLQNVFRTADDDRWVAISVRDDRDWAALTGVLQRPGLAELGPDASSRRAQSSRIRAEIAAWCRGLRVEEIVDSLQGAGVPAGEVMSEDRLLADPHLAARAWFLERSHPAVGTHRYPGHPWRSDDFELCHGRPLPGFGEDNEYVYLELLKWPRERYDDLVARGLITDRQLA